MRGSVLVWRFSALVTLATTVGAAAPAWSDRDKPEPGGCYESSFNATACSSPTACTAVGLSIAGSNSVTLAQRGTGPRGRHRPARTPDVSGSLWGGVYEAADCIAVGNDRTRAGLRGSGRTMGGASWKIQTSRSPLAARAVRSERYPVRARACTPSGPTGNRHPRHQTLAERWKRHALDRPANPKPPRVAGGRCSSVWLVLAPKVVHSTGQYSLRSTTLILTER